MTVEGVEHFRKVITRWDADHVDGADDLADLANLMFELDLLVSDLRMYRSRIEQEFAKRCDTKVFEFEGGTAEIKAGSKRKEWDAPLLLSRVVARAKDEREVNEATGEYESESDAVARALNECARLEWRLTPLRAMGLNPDNYCTVEWGLPHVIVRAKEQEGEK